MAALFFLAAISCMILAHIVRIIRWELFISVYEKPDRASLIKALSVGYLLNYILPFKLGDLVKAYLAGRKMKSGRALGLSTVIVDRFFDIVCVGLIFAGLAVNKHGGVWSKVSVYVILAGGLLLAALVIFFCRNYIKKVVKNIATIFNSNLEIHILQVSWALIWNFKDIFQKISKKMLLITTIGMWCGYLSSYFFFAGFLSVLGNGMTWSDVFIMLFAENGLKESTMVTMLMSGDLTNHIIYVMLYMLIPLFVLLGLSMYYPVKQRGNNDEYENYLNLLPHLDPKERLVFLENYFSGSNREYINNYLKINQGVSIIRDFSAGSNATTMLCMDEKKTFFRKYAFGEAGEKLYEQILWLEENADILAVPKILNQEKTELYCFYDMPFNPNAVGLFEYAHSMPIDNTWEIIKNVLKCLESSIYKMNIRPADCTTIEKYISSKVDKNIKKIQDSKYIKKLLQYDRIIINGVEYNNFGYYKKYLTLEYLKKLFANDTYAVIHGDLTIENIICTRDENGRDDFYIIDPNTGNVHDSPNLDYGKLLQSIHGGYEFLMATKEVKVEANRINFLFTRSSAYAELHERLRGYMQSNFGLERTKSIYFHEIIHWLRLMPYKIEKDGKRAILFYAGMIMVMNDVVEKYGDI